MEITVKCRACARAIPPADLAKMRVTAARDHIRVMADAFPFTDKERGIVLLAAEGVSYREIARLRGGTEQTVKNTMTTIFDITGSSSRAELQALFTLGQVPEKKLERSEIHIRRSRH